LLARQVIRAGDYTIPDAVDAATSAVFGLHGLPLPRVAPLTSSSAPGDPVDVTPDVIASTYSISGVTPAGSLTNRMAVAEFQVGECVVCLSLYLDLHLYRYLSITLSISIYLYPSLSRCLSICLSISLSVVGSINLISPSTRVCLIFCRSLSHRLYTTVVLRVFLVAGSERGGL
jgi:hypothetical protein